MSRALMGAVEWVLGIVLAFVVGAWVYAGCIVG
jgi:hypothetical protein